MAILVSGAYNSEKSYLVSKLIDRWHKRFERIVVIGKNIENVLAMNVIPDDFYNPLNESNTCESSLAIFDDVIFNPRIVKVAAECFTRGRHKNVSLIFCTRNLSIAHKAYRTITINLSVAFLHRIRDVRQVTLFGNTFLSNDKITDFIALLKKLVFEEQNYGYLMLNFTNFLRAY